LIFPKGLMPQPWEALAVVVMLFREGSLLPNLFATLRRMVFGFLGILILGTGMGTIMGLNSVGRRFLVPYVTIGFSIPAIAWAAMTTIIFGFSELAPITAAVLTAFPIVTINVWKGVENIDADLVDMSQSFDVSRKRLVFRTILPDTAPALFAAVRFGFAVSWKIVTIAEMFASSDGIGHKIIQSYEFLRFEQAWGWALVFMILILLIEYSVFKPLERRAFQHRMEADFALFGE